jgi:hypothetical protein
MSVLPARQVLRRTVLRHELLHRQVLRHEVLRNELLHGLPEGALRCKGENVREVLQGQASKST